MLGVVSVNSSLFLPTTVGSMNVRRRVFTIFVSEIDLVYISERGHQNATVASFTFTFNIFFSYIHTSSQNLSISEVPLKKNISLCKMLRNQEIVDTIKVMRMQEVNVYAVASDYLHQHQPQVDAMRGPINSKGLSVDADCRFKMAEWKRQVVDFCKFQRETVAISMSYLDRFLASPGGVDARYNRKIYQLASMAALYTAIKVNEPEAVDPKTVAGLSRGAHTEEQVEDMERQILFSIDWRLHPPTALAFCIHFLAVLPEMETDKKESVFALAKIQTELSVSDYFYVGVDPSTIAFASIVNAFQSLDATVDIQALHSLATVIGIDLSSKKVHEVKEKLFDAVVLTSPSSVPTTLAVTNVLTKTVESNRSSAGYVSPRGVNQQTTNY